MTFSNPTPGYCPVQKEETVVDVIYSHVRSNEYLQTGADCEFASFGNCPMMLDCPIRKSTPKTIFK